VKEFDDYTSNSSANNSAAKDISLDKENTMNHESPSLFNMSTAPIGSKPAPNLEDTLDLLGGNEDFSINQNRLSMATQNLIPKTPEVQRPASPSFVLTPSPKKSDRPKKAKRPSLLQQVQQRRIFQREIDLMSQNAQDELSTPEKNQSEEVNSAEKMRANILSLFISSPGSGSSADDEAESTEKLGCGDRTMAFAESEEPSNETIISDKTMAFEKTMAMDETVNLGRNRDFDKTVFMEQTVVGDPDSNCEDEANTSQAVLAKPIVVTPKTSRTLQNILDNPRTPEDVKKIATNNPFEIPSPKIRSPLVDFDGISREIDLLNGNNDAPPTPDFARSRGRQALMRARDSLGLAKHMQMKKFQRNVSDQSTTFDESARTALESLTPVAPKRLKMESELASSDSLGSIPALYFDGSIDHSSQTNNEMEESLVTPDTTEALELGKPVMMDKTVEMQKMTMKIEDLEGGKTAQLHARSLIGDNTLAQSAPCEDSELPDVPDQSEEINQFVTDLKSAFDAPKTGIVMKPLSQDRPHAAIMDNILLQPKVDLDKYLCDKFLRDMNKRKPAAVKFHYARDFDQFPIDLEKVMSAAKERARENAFDTIIRVQGDYLPLLDKMKHYRAEAEKVLKKNDELTPVLASLKDEHGCLTKEENDLTIKSRSAAEIQSEKDQLEKEMQELEDEISFEQEKIDAIPEVKMIDWEARCEAVAKKFNFLHFRYLKINLFIDSRLKFSAVSDKYSRYPLNNVHHVTIKHDSLRVLRSPALGGYVNTFRALDDHFIEYIADKANSMREAGLKQVKRVYPFINSHNEMYLHSLDKLMNFMKERCNKIEYKAETRTIKVKVMARSLSCTLFHVGFKLDFESLNFNFAGVLDPIDQYMSGVTQDINDAVAAVDKGSINYLLACIDAIEALTKMGSFNYQKTLYDNMRP